MFFLNKFSPKFQSVIIEIVKMKNEIKVSL